MGAVLDGSIWSWHLKSKFKTGSEIRKLSWKTETFKSGEFKSETSIRLVPFMENSQYMYSFIQKITGKKQLQQNLGNFLF